MSFLPISKLHFHLKSGRRNGDNSSLQQSLTITIVTVQGASVMIERVRGCIGQGMIK